MRRLICRIQGHNWLPAVQWKAQMGYASLGGGLEHLYEATVVPVRHCRRCWFTEARW